MLAAVTAISVAAAPLAKRVKAPTAETTQLQAAATKVQMKAPAKTDARTRVLKPQVRTAETRNPANLFRATATRTNIPVKAPYKINAKADAALPDFLGSMTWSDAWNDADEYAIGLYSIPTNATQTFDLKFLGPNANYGGVLVDNVYYTCDVLAYGSWILGVYYVGYDINTGEEVYNTDFSYYTLSMTYDSTTGNVYGVANIEDQLVLVKISFNEEELGLEPVSVVEPETMGLWNSIACDANGQLWGIFANYEIEGESPVCTSSTLYKIDKTAGTLTKIGDTGFDCTYMSDATFDLKTNKLYWTVSPAAGTGFLTEVNTSTGAAEVLYSFPLNEEVTGLAIPAPAADDKAPAAVTDAKAEFANGELSGTVSFNAPATLFDGTPATGALTYSIQANGEEVAAGNTTFGSAVSADVTMTQNGSYTFTITVANETGSSPKTQIKNVYVGKDTPAAPAVTATYDSASNTATVSWTAVTGSVNGGYMDASAITYTVTRYPGADVVAQNITETSVSDVLPEPEGLTKFYYEVVATCDGLASAAGVSEYIVVGSGLVPPFTVTFDDAEDLDLFTIIDANGDGKVWEFYNGYVRMNYNSSIDMDDWLISPPVKLEAGKVYDVLADIWAQNSSYKERIEVKIGKTPTVDGMTTIVLAPTEIKTTSGDPYKLSKPVIVDESGSYYIGFHGISDKDMFYLCLKNFGVTAPRSSDGPAAVTDLSVTADPTGAFNVTVSFVTPDKSINNNPITSLDKVELSRDNEIIKTWDNPAAGTPLSFNDVLDKGGDYLYSVVAYNAEGAGLAVESSVFVGFDYPEVPSNVTLVETENPGEITIAWDPVTKDVRGNTLPASEVTYQVYSIDGYYRDPVSEKISETSYTFQAVEPGKQDFVQYLVFAYSSGGESDGRYTPFKPVGTPFTTFSMSSLDDLRTYPLALNTAGGAEWKVGTNETFTDIPEAADGDGCYLYMNGQYLEQSAELYTGKIDLTDTPAPGMVIYCMPLALDDINPINITVTDLASGESTVVFSKLVNETGAPMTWNKVTIDLAAYAQKTVQFTLESIIKDYAVVVIDGWKLVSLLNNDLSVASVAAPGKVKAGEAYTVDVTVTNEGLKDAGAFSVELYADGELYDTKAVESLAADGKTTLKFDAAFSALATEAVTYTAKLVYAADENPDNNESESVTVTPIVSTLPAAANLNGTGVEGGVQLKWNEPDLNSVVAEAVTEDFENGNSFSATYGDWIFVDLDNSPIGGFSTLEIPGITAGVTTGSFWIWDNDAINLGDYAGSFIAHSGTKYLFAFYRDDFGVSNEWAISPELDGSAQTISFYAKSYSSKYPEKIKMCYSTGSTDPSDFTVVKTINTVAGDWTLYEFDVPAGAKRFAINSCSEDAFMLMVDDVTFVPANSTADLEIKGYDVYRDGVKINDAPVEECLYLDANVEDGKTYEYAVVVVYNKGLSAVSDVISVLYQASGIESIYGGVLTITTAKGSIVVTGADGQAVAVHTVDGKTIFSGQGQAKTVIPAQQGVYVVKAGKTVKKVLVK